MSIGCQCARCFPNSWKPSARTAACSAPFVPVAAAPSRVRQADGVFRSLPGGLSELVRTLVQSLPPGMVQTATEVTGIRDRLPTRSSADAVESSPRFLVERATGIPVEARAVILAAPAFATSALTRGYDADLSRLCGEIPYASSAAIVLAFDRQAVRHPLNGSGFVVPRVEGSTLLAVSWLSSKWPGPCTGRSCADAGIRRRRT